MAQFSVVLVTAPPYITGADPASALLKVDGREALLRSVELFLNRDDIKQIQLIVAPEHLEEIKKKHGAHLGFSGVKVLAAKAKFGEQIAAALEKVTAEATHVLVHDVARPCVPYTDIDALLASSTGKAPIVCLANSIRNPLVELDEGGQPIGVVPASSYSQVLTPMILTKAKFTELATAKREPHASELNLMGGSPLNQRISVPQDAGLAKALLAQLPKPKPRAASSPFEEAQW